jgi:hypothetical protein
MRRRDRRAKSASVEHFERLSDRNAVLLMIGTSLTFWLMCAAALRLI